MAKKSQAPLIIAILMLACCCLVSLSGGAWYVLSPSPSPDPSPSGSSPSPTPAPTYVEGQYVRIKREGAGDVLNIAEIGVFDDDGVLISKSKDVNGGSDAHGAGPYANLTNGVLADFAHTTSVDADDHITIDLGGVKKIGEIVVVNRKDCCQDRIVGTKLQVLLSDDSDAEAVKEIEVTEQHMVYSWSPVKSVFNSRTLPSGISTTDTWINKGTRPEGPYNVIVGDVIEEGDCYNATRAAGHDIYGFRTSSHPNPNTCFYYQDDPGWTDLSAEERLEDPSWHSIGCTDSSKKIEEACQ